jgi:hypothetical protein
MLNSNSNILSKILLKCIKFSNPCSIRDDNDIINIMFYSQTLGRDALTVVKSQITHAIKKHYPRNDHNMFIGLYKSKGLMGMVSVIFIQVKDLLIF